MSKYNYFLVDRQNDKSRWKITHTRERLGVRKFCLTISAFLSVELRLIDVNI